MQKENNHKGMMVRLGDAKSFPLKTDGQYRSDKIVVSIFLTEKLYLF